MQMLMGSRSRHIESRYVANTRNIPVVTIGQSTETFPERGKQLFITLCTPGCCKQGAAISVFGLLKVQTLHVAGTLCRSSNEERNEGER